MKNIVLAILICIAGLSAAPSLGVFDNSSDVGVTPKAGTTEFDAAKGEYRITGGGANVWGTADAFQFAWKRVSGDVSLQADVQFVGAGVIAHRKAMLMIRQSLEPNAVYGDAALHGDGLTSLQYRTEAAGITAELRASVNAPVRLRIERRGDKLMMFAGKPGEELQPTGPATLVLKDPVYVGLAVCSHKADTLETGIFSNVKLEGKPAQ